jgi:hypothetical protein
MGNLSFHTQHKDGTFVHTLTDHAGSSFVADTHTEVNVHHTRLAASPAEISMSTPPRSTAWAPSSQDLQGGCAPDGLRRGLAPRADADTNPSAIEPLSADQLGANGYTGSVNGRSVEAKPSSENNHAFASRSLLCRND